MTEIQAEALSRAKGGQSMTNYPAIYTGFMAKGIPEAEIKPRENVLTFQAWKAVGRCVRKGEHGVKVVTYVPMKNRGDDDDPDAPRETVTRPRTTTVFHVSQTKEMGADR